MALALTAFAVTAAATSPPRVPLAPIADVLEDESGGWTIDDVSREPLTQRFARNEKQRLSFGYATSAFWVRLKLDVPADAQPWLLEVGYGGLDHVQLYVRDNGVWSLREVGDRRPFAEREVRHPSFLFSMPPGSTSAYLRIQSSGSMVVPITLWRQDALLQHTLDEQLALGFYFAFLIAMAAYNLFVFLSVRDVAYLYYVGYMGGFVLFQASLSGYAFMYLWPEAPAWGSTAAVFFMALSVAGGLMFVRSLSHSVELAPRLHRAIGWLAILFVTLSIVALLHYPIGVRVATVLSVLTLFVIPLPIVIAIRNGYRPAWFLALGYSAILPGSLLLGLSLLDVLPSSFWVEHSVKIGTVLEALLLSFALADRINILKDDVARAERGFSKRLIAAQDTERRRMASELHDGVGQNLLVVVNKLKRFAKKSDDPEGARSLATSASGVVRELRSVAHDLHPHQLDREGLSAAVRATVTRTLDSADLPFDCEVADVDDIVAKQDTIHFFRIVQEALSNIVKHAQAAYVRVRLERLPDTAVVALTITDDGNGTASALTDNPGFGLASIERRVRLLGGELTISQAEPRGVSLEVTAPIRESIVQERGGP